MIPKTFIDDLLNRTNIQHLIESYVSLKRAGSNLVGLCPFHSEKTPSFTVFTGSNSFYCFGCGTGGDPITFVRKIENLDYPDAVEFLAKRMGMIVPQEEDAQLFQRSHVERKRVLDMNREAAKYFHQALLADHPGARAALDYLMQKRCLSMTTIKHFGLGYAPDSYDALTTHLLSLGYTQTELIEGYISFRSGNSGRVVDSFRNRVMFPIIDAAGNVIAFGGRVMDDSQPKYKNTSDTPAFKKSKNLYALNFARASCGEKLILCEGYMDVISLHAAGFENAVATLGTAITPEQARLISRYTKQVVISYDMDEAGRRAADKAMKLFEEVGVDIRLLKLEGAKDPDEYIQKNGAEKFRLMLEESDTKFAYNIKRILSKYDLKNPQQKISAVKEAQTIIASFQSETEREIYLRELAKVFEIDYAALARDQQVIQRAKKKDLRQKERQALVSGTLGYHDSVNPDFAKAPVVARFEEAVLGLLLLYPEYRKAFTNTPPSLVESDFVTAFGKKVFEYLKNECFGEESVNINEKFSPDEVGRITKMKVARMQLADNSQNVFDACVGALKDAIASNSVKESTPSFGALEQILAQKAKTEE